MLLALAQDTRLAASDKGSYSPSMRQQSPMPILNSAPMTLAWTSVHGLLTRFPGGITTALARK